MGPAYPSIVASGSNACVLHYIENNQGWDNELLLIDAGCAMVITTLILPALSQ